MAATHGVLFDVGYALLDESARLEAALAWLSAWLGRRGVVITPARLASLYQEACRTPGHPSLLVQTALAAGASPELAREQRRELVWDAVPMTALPGAHAALVRLRAAGLRVGVLANQPASAAHDLERLGLAGLLDGVWLSEPQGLSKPDPAFFRLALDAWGLPPGGVAYVGDRPDNDIGPARGLGLYTVRMRLGPHADQPARGPHEVAHHDATSLAEAAEHLVAWAAAR